MNAMYPRATELAQRCRLALAILRGRDSSSCLMLHTLNETTHLRAPNAGPDTWMRRALVDAARVATLHLDSSLAASIYRGLLAKLLALSPLRPIMGTADEWAEVHETDLARVYQNRRRMTVFKEVSKDGSGWRAYDLDGAVFEEPDGYHFTDSRHALPIEFPYVGVTLTIPVPVNAGAAELDAALRRAMELYRQQHGRTPGAPAGGA